MDLQQIPMNIFIFSASSREVKMGAFWLRWCLFKKYILFFTFFLNVILCFSKFLTLCHPRKFKLWPPLPGTYRASHISNDISLAFRCVPAWEQTISAEQALKK